MGLEDMLSSAWWSHSHADRCQSRRWVRQTPLIYWLLRNGPYLRLQSAFCFIMGVGLHTEYLFSKQWLWPVQRTAKTTKISLGQLYMFSFSRISVYSPSLVLNEPSGIKHHSGLIVLVRSVCWTFCWNPNEKRDKKRRKEQSDRQQKKKWISGDECWWSRSPLLEDAVTTPSGSNDCYSNSVYFDSIIIIGSNI